MSFLSSLAREARILRGAFYQRVSGVKLDGDITTAFHQLYYDARTFNKTWRNTFWQGHAVLKCPLDLWLYQEVIHKMRPAVIVETGTAFGGSALFMAHMCDIVGHGRIISVDLESRPVPQHPRITYLTGSSIAPEMVAKVKAAVGKDGPVMVVLDSDHRREHVAAELEAYSGLVTSGSYLVVEDTNLNGHPVEPDHGPGPFEAVQAFVAAHPEFQHDTEMEKFLLTFNPKGFLKRKA